MSFQVGPILQGHFWTREGHKAAMWVIAVRNRAEVWVESAKSTTGSNLSVIAFSLTHGNNFPM